MKTFKVKSKSKGIKKSNTKILSLEISRFSSSLNLLLENKFLVFLNFRINSAIKYGAIEKKRQIHTKIRFQVEGSANPEFHSFCPRKNKNRITGSSMMPIKCKCNPNIKNWMIQRTCIPRGFW